MKRKLVRQNRRIFAATGRKSIAKKQSKSIPVEFQTGNLKNKLWYCLEIIGIFSAVFALYYTWQSFEETRKQTKLAYSQAEQNRIISAWQILATKAPGNSGKKEALENLHGSGLSLQGIDLGCKRMENRYAEDKPCRNGALLVGLKLIDATLYGAVFDGADLRSATFSNSRLWNSSFKNGKLMFSNFSNAELRKTNLSKANLSNAILNNIDLTESIMREVVFGRSIANRAIMKKSILHDSVFWEADLKHSNLISTELLNSDFSRADLSNSEMGDANFEKVNLTSTNISAVKFCSSFIGYAKCAKNLTQPQIKSAWAWRDRPPLFQLGYEKIDLTFPPLCDPALRPEYEKKQKYGKPKGC